MDICKIINPSNPKIFNTSKATTTKLPLHLLQTCRRPPSLISANSSSTTQTQTPEPKSSGPSLSKVVKFKTLGSCKLGIAKYPDFSYNADGGKGTGLASEMKNSLVKKTNDDDDDDDDEISVCFDVGTLYIPALSSQTTKFLGLPLPPFLKIEIVPEFFQGVISQQSGKVDLEFKAKFCFSVGSIYRAPPLIVKTVLTSEESIGTIRRGTGQRLNEEGVCRLVGVATVEPIDDFFMNSFLGLPTECLADLSASISLDR